MPDRKINPIKPAYDSSAEERRLIQRLLGDEAGAWRDFVMQFQGLVVARVAQTMNQCHSPVSPADRDDVVAEVFSILIHDNRRALRKFSFNSSIATWLTVITHRCCLKHTTRQRRQASQLLPSQTDVLSDSTDNALDQMVNFENRSRLRQNMRHLKISDQRVLELFYFDSLGYREIGQRMGISSNSVGPKLHRAQQRLKKLMEERA